jgi:hypothetical protein
MTDVELRERFEDLTLSVSEFSHREHLRIAWMYLRDYPLLRVLEIFPANLKRFASSVGAHQLYHETITWAFLMIISERMVEAHENFDDFLRSNDDLTRRDFLDRYYQREVLESRRAREHFVFPVPWK